MGRNFRVRGSLFNKKRVNNTNGTVVLAKKQYRKIVTKPLMSFPKMLKTWAPSTHRVNLNSIEYLIFYDNDGVIGVADFNTPPPGVPALGVTVSTPVENAAHTFSFGVGFTFWLSNLPRYANYQNTYDQYRFRGATMEAMFLSANRTNGGAGYLPELYSYIDHDDGVAPANYNIIATRKTLKCAKMEQTKTFKRVFCPKPTQNLYAGAVTTGYANPPGVNPWIDTLSPSAGVEHYGMKLFINNMPAVDGDTSLIRIRFTFNMEFKDPL